MLFRSIYFGHGEEISHIAGRIKQNGQFVMLMPKNVPVNGPAVASVKDIPLPKPRPGLIVTAAARTNTPAAANHPATRRKPRH